MLFIDPFDLCLQMGKISAPNMRKFNIIFPGFWVELEQQVDPLKRGLCQRELRSGEMVMFG